MALQICSNTDNFASATVDEAAATLAHTLDELYEHFKALLDIGRRKLMALRSADAAGLSVCTAEEGRRLEELFVTRGARDAILARLAQSLPGPSPGKPRLSQIAENLPEPQRSRITAKIVGLRNTALELREKNKIAAAVARGLHTHICAVFAAVAKCGEDSNVYTQSGQSPQRGAHAWVDALG